tara:strand:- start:347 stop:634 length:288 start_codon:yes stop_codon:yes gene_type:complete
MAYSDVTSKNISSGDIIDSSFNIQRIVILFLIGGAIYFYSRKKKKTKSGIALINLSISTHNEKIAVVFAVLALSIYGLDVYLRNRNHKEENGSSQ